MPIEDLLAVGRRGHRRALAWLHLDRISDNALTPVEPPDEATDFVAVPRGAA